MKDTKTHINIRLAPETRKALRIHCAKEGITAQKLIADFIDRTLKADAEKEFHSESARVE